MAEKTGIVYLQKDKFQLYSPLVGRILEFRFAPEIVRDLDIINGELLENYVKTFIVNSKIASSNLVFVLADNAYFVKDFSLPDRQKTGASLSEEVAKELLQKQADEFIEHVPFDNVVSKVLPVKDGLKVCATNKDFYESIVIAFEHLGFTVESILPGFAVGNGMSSRSMMDQAMVNEILQKISTLKQYSLLGQQVFQPQAKLETEGIDEVELEQQETKKTVPNKKRLYALSGIFVSLIIVLVIVYVQSQTPPTPPKQPAFAANPTPQSATPVLLATVIPTVSAQQRLLMQNLTVQIIGTANSASIAQNLLGRLNIYKFKSVSIQTQNSLGNTGSLIAFSPGISQDVRNTVLNEVKKFANSVLVEEKQIGAYDITITLGQ